MFRIAVLLSGAGSNFVSVSKAIEDGTIPNSEIVCVISDNPGAKGLEHANSMGLSTYALNRKELKSDLSDEILKILKENEPVDLIILAGFLSILKGDIIDTFENKIINIHPSLIPAFCGQGMWGLNVHKAVIDYGAKVSGCTTHFVDGGTDTGAIILQRVVPVTTEDPKQLQKDIIVEEHKLLVETVAEFAKGNVVVDGRKVKILDEKGKQYE